MAKYLLLPYPECRPEILDIFSSIPLETMAKSCGSGRLLNDLEILTALRVIYADEAYLTPEAKLVVKTKSKIGLSARPLPVRPV